MCSGANVVHVAVLLWGWAVSQYLICLRKKALKNMSRKVQTNWQSICYNIHNRSTYYSWLYFWWNIDMSFHVPHMSHQKWSLAQWTLMRNSDLCHSPSRPPDLRASEYDPLAQLTLRRTPDNMSSPVTQELASIGLSSIDLDADRTLHLQAVNPTAHQSRISGIAERYLVSSI